MLVRGATGGFGLFLSKLREHLDDKPWQLPYEERRIHSKEARVQHQVHLEAKWQDTPVEGIWAQLRAYVQPSKNYLMTKDNFEAFLRGAGISNCVLLENLSRLFYELLPLSDGCISGLHLCEVLRLSLADPVTSQDFVRHCFETLPHDAERPDIVDVDSVNVKLDDFLRPRAMEKPEAVKLLAVKKVMIEFATNDLTLAIFSQAFLGKGFGWFVACFVKQLFEVTAKVYKEPLNRLPYLSSRWLASTSSIEYNPYEPMDADALLLQSYERAGKGIGGGRSSRRRRRKSHRGSRRKNRSRGQMRSSSRARRSR